ncbi:MAG TPA: hypothetical protein VKF40_30815 [Burkholderiales bacterium]|nr:hypothetical protein [Burkholderiales bacterium]
MDARSNGGRVQQYAANMAEIFFQGAVRLADIQTTAARVLLQTQGRSATMFGAPDWTQAINRQGEQFSQLMSAGAEQALKIIRQTNDTVSQVQEQFGRLLELQVAEVSEEMRSGVKEVSRRTEEGLEQLRQTTRRATSEGYRALGKTNGGRHQGRAARRG